ncbi:MAG: hypothetical protein HC945_01645 [Nitrosarchaeum sp.]|nr:hypothetical protein [Nitrosarchaeum sp.]
MDLDELKTRINSYAAARHPYLNGREGHCTDSTPWDLLRTSKATMGHSISAANTPARLELAGLGLIVTTAEHHTRPHYPELHIDPNANTGYTFLLTCRSWARSLEDTTQNTNTFK